MKKEGIAERLKKIMEERNLKQQVDILELAKPFCDKFDVKLSKSDLSQYMSGKVKPGAEKLKVLALALKVNEEWLLGYDVDKNIASSLNSLNSETKTEQKLKLLARHLDEIPDDKREKLIKNFEDSIDVYLDALGISKEDK